MSAARPYHGRLRAGGAVHRVDLRLEDERLHGSLDGTHVDASVRPVGPGIVALAVGGRRVLAVVARRQGSILVSIDGEVHEVSAADGAEVAEASAVVEPFAVSPMTGVLAKVHVAPGAAVARGAPLFAVEAMKMEYLVKADRDVVVAEVRAKAGDRVDLGAVVVTFVAEAPPSPGEET